MTHKGSWVRPRDEAKHSEGYDRVYGEKKAEKVDKFKQIHGHAKSCSYMQSFSVKACDCLEIKQQ